ncbi:MAG: mannosyl-3-phosphoglycerate phosphatase [Thermodesulfobacteriota bacterium]
MPKFVIFSDLDGTLLDNGTYSFLAATEALHLISSKDIPLVLCSSKTRKEIELYRRLLDNNCPFISENGGGIFIPNAYFSKKFEYDREVDGYKVIDLGTSREILSATLKSISEETGIQIIGFSDMTVSEIADLTGLDEETAKLAMVRDHSEPFIIPEDEKYTATIEEQINLKGYRHTRGGRFHHILGENDKGKAVKILGNIYKSEFDDIETVGLGDSLNDLPMLETVDIPILVQKPGGNYDPMINLSNLIYANGIGPSGWNSSILKLFNNVDLEPLIN